MKPQFSFYLDLVTKKFVQVEEEIIFRQPNYPDSTAYLFSVCNTPSSETRASMLEDDFTALHEKIDFVVYQNKTTKELVMITKTTVGSVTYIAMNAPEEEAVTVETEEFFRACSFHYDPKLIQK